jgi:hypothetical protein
MIVEPAPTNPRTPARRTLRLVGVAVPVILLVGVVAAGSLGPGPAPVASPGPAAVASAAVVASPFDAFQRPAVLPDGTTTTFPATWIGFRVRSVTETRARRQDGGAEGILAVAGYLSYGDLDWTCVDAYLDPEAVCDGRALLADTDVLPTDANGGVFGAIGPHLHPTFAPGVRGPTPSGMPSNPPAEPIPVVVLGRYTDPAGVACSPTSRDCGQAFAVERVVWVAGKPWGETLSIDAAMDVEPDLPEIEASADAATVALGRGALALRTSVVRRDLLDVIGPDAAAALPAPPPGDRYRPLTYVRGLVFLYDPSQPVYGRDPEIAWLVANAMTGEVLARGGPSRPGAVPVGSFLASAADGPVP